MALNVIRAEIRTWFPTIIAEALRLFRKKVMDVKASGL